LDCPESREWSFLRGKESELLSDVTNLCQKTTKEREVIGGRYRKGTGTAYRRTRHHYRQEGSYGNRGGKRKEKGKKNAKGRVSFSFRGFIPRRSLGVDLTRFRKKCQERAAVKEKIPILSGGWVDLLEGLLSLQKFNLSILLGPFPTSIQATS